MANKNIKSYKVILSVLIFFIVVMNITYLQQICVIDDEFGYWGTAAYFAGYDWTGVSGTSPYYGYGLGFFYSIFYKIFHNPVMMYRAAICLNGIFLVISFLLSIRCCEELFLEIDKKYTVLICFILSLYPNTIVQTQIAWTETILYLWFWVLTYLIIVIQKTRKTWPIIVFVGLLIYGVMIHQRTLGVLLSGVLTIVVLSLDKKISVKQMIYFFIVLILGLVVFIGMKDWLETNFWGTIDVSVQELNNLSGQVSKIQSIFSYEGIKEFFYGVIAKVGYLVISTHFIILVSFFWLSVQCLKFAYYFIKRKNVDIPEDSITAIFLWCSFVSSFMIAAITTAKLDARADVLLYGRYTEFVIGPLLLIGFVLIEKNFNKSNKVIYFFLASLVMTIVICCAIKKYDFTSFHATNAVGLGPYMGGKYEFATGLMPLLLLEIIIVIIWVVWSRKRYIGNYFIFLVLMLGITWCEATSYNSSAIYSMQEKFSENITDVVAIIKDSKTKKINYILDDINGGKLNDDLYDRNIKYLQFYLYDSKIDCINLSEIDFIQENQCYVVRKESEAFLQMMKDVKIREEMKYCNELYAIFYVDMTKTNLGK